MPKPIRIGVDLRNLKKARTGTYTYLKEISEALRRSNSKDVRLTFFAYPFPIYTGKNYFFKIIEHLLDFLWIQVALPLLCLTRRCHVLLCTDYFSPVFCPGTHRVIVFHDCFFFDHPNYYNQIWLRYFKTFGLLGAKRASAIVVPSHYVQKSLGDKVPHLKNKISVVYEGCRHFQNPTNIEKVDLQEWSQISNLIQKRPFAVYVGTLDKRKNLDRLIHAFEAGPSKNMPDVCLVLAGSSPAYQGSDYTTELKRLVEHKGLEQKILFTGRVQEETLKRLYENALFLVQPSLDEGFGLTLTEAMNFNLPFIASNNTAMPEIGGNAGLYFDPFDEKEIQQTMEQMYSDRDLRNQLIHNSSAVRLKFDWDRAAAEFIGIFKVIQGAQ